jgi:hypothetical protein
MKDIPVQLIKLMKNYTSKSLIKTITDMYLKSLISVICISILFSCNSNESFNSEKKLLKLLDSLYISTQTKKFVILISPNSRCLGCDKKFYDFYNTIPTNSDVYFISCYSKDRLFNKENNNKIYIIDEETFSQIFNEYIDFSRIILVQDNSVKKEFIVTTDYQDTLLSYIQKEISIK